MYMYIYVYIYTCVYIYIYKYMYIHILTLTLSLTLLTLCMRRLVMSLNNGEGLNPSRNPDPNFLKAPVGAPTYLFPQ